MQTQTHNKRETHGHNLPYRVGTAKFASKALAEAYAQFLIDDGKRAQRIRKVA